VTTSESGKLFDYLEKVRALLAKSERTTNEAEKVAYLEKAQEIMRKYRIDEEQLIASGDPTAATPIQVVVDLCARYSEFLAYYAALAESIADHVGARVQVFGYHAEKKAPAAAFVGYESDVRVAVELLTAAQLVFGEKLEPKLDPSKSETENIYRLRSSGKTRREVAAILWGPAEGSKASAHAKVGRVYKQECDRRGERPALDGKGLDLDVFRISYAREFYWTLDKRLEAARDAADSVGGVLVLAGRKERVDEAFYTFHPSRRPKPKTEVATQPETNKTPSKVRKITKAQQRATSRKYFSPAARAGEMAGANAAGEVQISRITPKKQRLDEPGGSIARSSIEG
jgi:hypothetical protein